MNTATPQASPTPYDPMHRQLAETIMRRIHGESGGPPMSREAATELFATTIAFVTRSITAHATEACMAEAEAIGADASEVLTGLRAILRTPTAPLGHVTMALAELEVHARDAARTFTAAEILDATPQMVSRRIAIEHMREALARVDLARGGR